MIIKRHVGLLLSCLFLTSVNTFGQTGLKSNKDRFSINNEINILVDSKIRSIDSSFHGVIDIKLYKGDSLVFDTDKSKYRYELRVSSGLAGNDTIFIVGSWFINHRFQLTIVGDKLTFSCFVPDKKEQYNVTSTFMNLTLDQKPKFIVGEVLLGIIDFATEEFLQSDAKTEKLVWRAYFRTKPLKLVTKKDKG
jgi:hypothetical protein